MNRPSAQPAPSQPAQNAAAEHDHSALVAGAIDTDRWQTLQLASAVLADESRLDVVVQHLVSTARELVRAGACAVGVIGPEGALAQVVRSGVDDEKIPKIGGVPDAHAQTGNFLSLPIRVAGEPFANLYLAEPARGEFDRQDQALAAAFASIAGLAIQNARAAEESERSGRWQAASTETIQQLFFRDIDQRPIDIVLRGAMVGAGADAALLGLRVDDEVVVESAVGALAEVLTGGVMRLEDSFARDVLIEGKPVLITDYPSQSRAAPLVASTIKTVIIAPLIRGDEVIGALAVGHVDPGKRFLPSDLDHFAAFANHAGIALELDDARADRESLILRREYHRIASELQDHVVPQLFTTSIGLQGIVGGLERPEDKLRVSGYIDGLDAVARGIRTAIYENAETISGSDLERRLCEVIADQELALGFGADIDISGLAETTLAAQLGDDLVAVLREVLANSARNTTTKSVSIQITCEVGVLTMEFVDDVRLDDTPSRASRLNHLRRRAAAHGGALAILSSESGGTHLLWTARTREATRSS